MVSSILVGIPYHVSDDKYYLDTTLLSIREKLGKDVDILIVTDENSPILSVPTKVYQTRVQGHGVGKARNAAGLYAYYNKYDCLIFMDSHMIIISDDYLKICNSKIGHPKIVLAEIYDGPMKDILKYIIPPMIDRNRYTLSSFLDRDTWRWAYIYSTMTNKTVMTTEPSYALSREVIEALIQAQGKLTLAEYWGKESFDLTISAARLGYTIDIYPTIEIAHIYKVGSPSWSSRFTETRCVHEPYCGILTGSVYHNGIKWGDCVFALKHYSDITDFLPTLEGRGFPPKGFIVPTIGSGLHPSFGGQSSGSENHSHLALGYPPQRGLSLPSSSPLKEGGDTGCSSLSPIKPSIELGRSVISVTKRNFDKEIFKLSTWGYPSGEVFRTLNSQLYKLPVDINVCEKVKIYDSDAMARIRQFNSVAKYTLDDVYKKLSEFLRGASYGFIS